MREMKDSNIMWIGNIPNKWSVQRLKHVCDVIMGQSPKNHSVNELFGIPFMQGATEFGKTNPNVTKYCAEPKKISRINDILMTVRAPVGKINISDKEYCIGRGLCSIKATKIHPSFLKYFIMKSQEDFNYYSNGTTYDAITIDDVNNFKICIPPLEGQIQISNFLNDKCTKIDEVISRQRTIIEKSEEYKTALVSHVVLHGIHVHQKMKDSGVEWISQIPESWEMKRGKWLFKETAGRSKDGSEELLTVSQYTGITPRSQKNVTMFEAESLIGYKICHVGDIAANTMWLWAGAIGVSDYEGVISPSYNVYQQIVDAYESKYLDYLLRAVPLVQHYKALSTGIRPSRLRLYPSQFLNIEFPIPPKTEQIEIIEYLKDKIDGIFAVIERKKAVIEKLEEYKKSIIFNAVTGKIDLSNVEL